MVIYENSFIGYVDILGYKNFEYSLRKFGASTSEALLSNLYRFLDSIIDSLGKESSITWTRYGDGYVFYTKDQNIDNLSEIIRKSCRLLATSLDHSVPLRIAITQNTLHVDPEADGETFSGPGWDILRGIENSLNWMGGFLFLPQYDGKHEPFVTELVQTTILIQEQNHEKMRFKAPFKNDLKFSTSRTWFLNWYKCFNQEKSIVDRNIKNWWSQFYQGSSINNSEEVKLKQQNTIKFADYCKELRQAVDLVFFSEINKNFDIGKIHGSC